MTLKPDMPVHNATHAWAETAKQMTPSAKSYVKLPEDSRTNNSRTDVTKGMRKHQSYRRVIYLVGKQLFEGTLLLG